MKRVSLILGVFLLADCRQPIVKVKVTDVTLTNVKSEPAPPVLYPPPPPGKTLDSVWFHALGRKQLLISDGKVFLGDSLVYEVKGDDSARIAYKSPHNRLIVHGDTAILFLAIQDGNEMETQLAIRLSPGRATLIGKEKPGK